ncbi:MAG: hypothetical protein II972_04370 [Elusimicrobiaceae bacterium]|nr:hypothetical protein [Elusimicrobiaceae bacterium]
MLRKILCDFEFIYRGRIYKAFGFYLGDTTLPQTFKTKDVTPQIVCQSFKIGIEELGKILKVHYWDIDRNKLELAGFKFVKIQLKFFPPLSRDD